MTFKNILTASVALTGLCATGFAPQAFAQEQEVASEQPAEAKKTLSVVTVTAQRREENLQEVPVAVTALSAEQLADRQIGDVNDIASQIPSAVIVTGGGTSSSARVYFRGIGEDESRGAVDPAVGIYLDGIFLGRSIGSLLDLVDTQRVEVLRGPQGTLYGRNTNGGAIKLVSVEPQDENAGDLSAGIGNYGSFNFKGMGNLALGDNTAVRVSGVYKERDGLFELNPNGASAGLARDNLGKEEVAAARISVKHHFNDDWSLLFAADHTQDNSDPSPSTILTSSNDPSVVTDVDNDLFTIEPVPGAVCSPAPQIFQQVGCFANFSSEVEISGASLKIDGAIGDYDFASLTGYRQMKDDLSSHIGFPFSQQTDQSQLSQEFTLSSAFDGPFNYMVGAFFYNEEVQLDSVFFFPFSVGIDTNSAAAFSQVNFEATDKITLTGGLRYTTETRDVVGSSGAPGAASVAFPLERNLDEDNLTYSVKASYQATDSIMVYGSVSNGFKSAGVSPDCFAAASCFLPVTQEDLVSWETGIRSDLFDNAVRFNLTYFNNSYEDLQISATVPGVGFTRSNVGEAAIQGIELETSWFATDNLEFYMNGSWLDAEYQNLTAADAGIIKQIDPAVAGPADAACPGLSSTPGAMRDSQLIACGEASQLKNAPETKASLGFQYSIPAFDGYVKFGGDLAYEADSYALVANNPGSLISPGTRVNARVGYAPEDKGWRVSLWGKNLTDKEYYRNTTSTNHVYAELPLTWGVDFGVSF
ncbi:TonB-dependent receptor [Hirschia litorea]|uniref:TonB-dependent receptor n=1 Tax=Hirschia litorea TaxID=1199156 RepID=A0ABW2IN76_9PROT